MKIRKAILSDLEQLVSLFEAYRIFYRKSPAREQAKSFIESRLTKEDSIIYLAEDDGHNIVGFTQLYPSFSSTRMSRMWILNDLYVDPSQRGKGISKLLINEAKDLCKQTNASGILLETEQDNTIGNKLYPATGFELEQNNFYFWANN